MSLSLLTDLLYSSFLSSNHHTSFKRLYYVQMTLNKRLNNVRFVLGQICVGKYRSKLAVTFTLYIE